MFAPKVKVADEVWIATALLHLEHPEHESFSVKDIVQRASREALYPWPRSSLMPNTSVFCVANKPPGPANYRMLYETERAHRRLFREGDTSYPGRRGKIVPNQYDIPRAYWPLLQWYHETYNQELAKCSQARPNVPLHPLHELHTLRDLANYLRQLDHDIDVEEPYDPRDQPLFICANCEGEIYVSQPDPNISVGEDFYNLVRIDPRLLAPCNEGEDWMLLRFPLNEFNP